MPGRGLGAGGRLTTRCAAALLAVVLAGTAPAEAQSQTLALRVGSHPGYGRLVFDGPQRIDYTVEQDGSRVTIRFVGPPRLDIAAARQNIRNVVSVTEGQGGIVIEAAPGVRLRHFRLDNRIVLDFHDGTPDAVPVAAVPAPAVAPPRETRPAAVPAQPRPPAATAAPRAAPAAAAPTGLTQVRSLEEALTAAYASNPTLLAARAQQRATDELVPQALSGWRPTIVITGSVGYADGQARSQAVVPAQRDAFGNLINPSTVGVPFAVYTDVPRDTANVAATITQPIFTGGRTAAGTRRAENQVFAQRSRLLVTEQQVLLDAIAAYVAVIRDTEVVRLNANNVTVLLRQLQATAERYRLGDVTRTDVAQAESRLAGARASLEQAEGNLQSSRAVFESVIGLAPARDLPTPPILVLPVHSAAETADAAAGNNPNVVAAMFDEAAARDNIDLQFGALLPSVSVQGQVYRLDNNSNATRGTRNTGAQVTANLSVPLFQGGYEQSLVRQARQQAQQARQVIDVARRQARQQGIQAWEALQTARAEVENIRAQIRAQEIALDGVQREAILGSRTTLDVLNAEQELLNARVRMVQAVATLVSASYAVNGAIGRMTARDLGLPVQVYDPRSYYNAVRDRWVGTGDFSEQAGSQPAPSAPEPVIAVPAAR